MYKSQNKWCYVPGCKNTSISAPNKLFLSVPQDYSRKVLWFKAARRDFPKSKSMFFCCEDHFNLEQDMENYVRYKLVGGKIFLKAGVVPHVFNCQQDRKRAASAPERSIPLKRERRRLVEDALTSEKKQTNKSPAAIDIEQSLNQPSTRAVAVRPEADEHTVEVFNAWCEMACDSESQYRNVQNIPVPEHKYYKCCIVPKCGSTTVTAPNKLFFNVPKDEIIRMKWCSAMKRDLKKRPVSVKSTLHICEDHFNLMHDMENYIQYQLMGQKVKNLKLKTGVMPHIFVCQKVNVEPQERYPLEKKRRSQLMETEIKKAAAASSCAAVQVPDGIIELVTQTFDKAIQVNLQPKFQSKATNT